MKIFSLIFVLLVELLNVGCRSTSNVAITQTGNFEERAIQSNINQNLDQIDVKADPTPPQSIDSRIKISTNDSTSSKPQSIENPELDERYRPGYLDPEEKSDNGYEPFCVQTKIKGKIERRCGYQNIKGKILIKPMFKIAYVFSEGLAGVCPKQDGLCGYINKKGQLVIKWYQCVDKFSEGLAVVCVGDTDYYKYGYINKEGEYVIHPQYSDANAFKNGIAEVTVQRTLNKCINKKNVNVECAK